MAFTLVPVRIVVPLVSAEPVPPWDLPEGVGLATGLFSLAFAFSERHLLAPFALLEEGSLAGFLA